MSKKIVPAAARSGQDIDKIAYDLIASQQPACLQEPQAFDVESFFEFDLFDITGVSTSYTSLPGGIHGITDSKRMTSCVEQELLERRYSLPFARSTIGHECGHVIIHVPEYKKKKECLCSIQKTQDDSPLLYRKEDVPTYQNPEWQAHRFAGALLVPEKTLQMLLKQGKEVREIAEIYQVTEKFIYARLRALKIGKLPNPTQTW